MSASTGVPDTSAGADTEVTVTPSQTARAIFRAVRRKQPVFLWGKPGIGKSDVVWQVGASEGMDVLDLRASLIDPVELKGVPFVNGERLTGWATPDFFPRDPHSRGILFLDELNRAPLMVQNALFQLILNRRLGDYTLPDGWAIVAAGNREGYGGGTTKLSPALANRFVHLNVTEDLVDWCAWAVQHRINPMVIAFLRFRPNLLCQFSRTAPAFPTPRSWAFVSTLEDEQSGDPETDMALVAGAVGKPAAVEYLGFTRLYRALPNPDAILLNPETAPVPDDVATLYAVSAALAHRANDQNFGQVLAYAVRLPKEYEVYLVKDATARDSLLGSNHHFTTWAATNPAAL